MHHKPKSGPAGYWCRNCKLRHLRDRYSPVRLGRSPTSAPTGKRPSGVPTATVGREDSTSEAALPSSHLKSEVARMGRNWKALSWSDGIGSLEFLPAGKLYSKGSIMVHCNNDDGGQSRLLTLAEAAKLYECLGAHLKANGFAGAE